MVYTVYMSSQTNMRHIIDVRTKDEFESGAVDGAINFPVEDILAGQMPEVAKESTIYVYCRSGGRSERAKDELEARGFTHVTNIGGLVDAREYMQNLQQSEQ